MAEEVSLDKRLKAAEGYIAESRDDNDLIRLSEITERIQEVIHSLELMNLRIEGIENKIQAQGRLMGIIATGVILTVLLAIGAAALVVILLERLL